MKDTSYPIPRRGFTLIQILVVLGILAVLAAITVGVVSKGRVSAQRAQCDMNVKTIAVALDAFRQERGRYPASLSLLVSEKFLTEVDTLHCPADPRTPGEYDPAALSPKGSYAEYYITRAPRAPRGEEPPVLVCPLHEQAGNHGVQAYVGRQTKQFATRPAELIEANGAFIQRPGKESMPATAGIELHGGDRIRTRASGGKATIRFVDGSTCEILGGSDVTILQCFMQSGSARKPFYTLLRQNTGDVTYTVQNSEFDVVTPTATAGAKGTKFRIRIGTGGVPEILFTEGKRVQLETLGKVADAPFNIWYRILPRLPGLPPLNLDDLLGGLL
jgi:prepilin-type N-terminal cleavage/methylation domain-containing protein